ncbi:MAG TPA: hypothetical protein VFJ91_08045 [Gaiellaceae bacterium]|nr:hypothetical protein [Gaiellaceae bacterium]
MRRLVAPGVVAALALTGCGSGRLSHDQYVAHADAICSAYDQRVQLLTRPTSYEDIVAYVGQTLPLYVAALDKLAALQPPRDDERAVRSWLALNRKVVEAVRTLRAAAMRHDLAGTNDASAAVQAASLASRRAAAALGTTACASP